MTIVTLGIDLGKNLNTVTGLDAEGQVVLRRRVRRATLAELAGRFSPRTVAMEVCCGAHHVGRLFAAKGHEVRLMSPEYVRPYVRAQKNDANDAAGTAEAAPRPTMRFVELKSQDRLDLQTSRRARSRLVAARKVLVNQLRAILLERGQTFRQGLKVLEREIDPLLAEPPSDLSTRILTLIGDRRAEWRSLDEQIDSLNDDLTEHARADEAASRLISIPGIGVLGGPYVFCASRRGAWRTRGPRARRRSISGRLVELGGDLLHRQIRLRVDPGHDQVAMIVDAARTASAAPLRHEVACRGRLGDPPDRRR